MHRFTLLACLFALAFPIRGEAQSPTSGAEGARVLILGDSISIGYMPFVKTLLQKEAFVTRPMQNAQRAENCAGTTNGVKQIDRWLKLEGGDWDVIHFNFGLHDLKREDPKTGKPSSNPADPNQASPEAYEKQLEEVVKKLKATGAELIFATTTPVPEGKVSPHRDLADVEKYNALAKKIMKEHGVAINDLYALALPKLKEIQRPVNVHFTPAGSELLAKEVVKHIREALKESAKK